ncbi:peptidase domain-containing ABC transporter [Sneathiella marina]|uniref:Peptidase domain-containing ABC transporter n=1 Tax=Sneathiella marina TaxID=2950108 RepID=A0ABY4W5U2_9PROT|nr:peptidase domain-containing ABC transporter [Sneathiella marina]USG62289.1 peptidase domain-containing ABC transporter [Sneathiella marina]
MAFFQRQRVKPAFPGLDDKPMLRQARLPKLRHGRADIIYASGALNVLALALPIMILQVYDRIIPNNATETLLLLVIGVGIAVIFEACFRLARSYLTARAGASFEHIAGCRALHRTLGTDIVRFEKEATGVYLHRFNAIESLREFMSGHSLLVFIDLPFAFIFMFLVGFIAGPLIFVPLILLVIFAFVTLAVGHGLKKALNDRSVWDERRYNFLIEVLTGIHTVKGLALEAQMVRRYERLQETTANVIRNVAFKNNIAQSLGTIFSQITLVAVAAYGSVLVINESLTIGGLAACTLLSGRALQPLLRAMGVWTHYQNIKLSQERVKAILELPQEKISDPAEESKSPATVPIPVPQTGSQIELEDVTFGYGGNTSPLFEKVNATFTAGKTTAISGANGSGKTTLLWLMMGLITPQSGRVLLNGVDIAKADPIKVRQHIAYLPQTGIVFHGTIMENLTMFRRGPIVDEAVKQCKTLGLDSVIKRLPKGYDTVIGEGAMDSLPGGVRQRIAIARAIVTKPEVILFDEANTSLDMSGDEILKNALLQLKDQSTIILVSHRPSLLKISDSGYKIQNRNVVATPIENLTSFRPAATAPKLEVVSAQ